MSSKRITCKGRVMAFLLAFATAMSSFPMTNVFADDDVDSTSVSASSEGTDSVTVMLESGSGGTLKATLPDGTVYTSSENEENSFEMESGTKITLAAIPDQGYKVGVYQIDTADGEHYSEEGKDDGSPVSNRVTISEDAYVVANYEEISTESSSSSSSSSDGSETDKTPVVDGSSTSSSSTSSSSTSSSSSESGSTEGMVPFVSGLEYAEENGEIVTDKEDNDFWKAVAGEGTKIYEAKMDIIDPSMIEQQNYSSDPTNPVAAISDVSARSLTVDKINKNLKIDQHTSVVVRYIAPGDPGMSTGYYTTYGYHINMAYLDADITKTQPSCPTFTFQYNVGKNVYTVHARGWRWAYCVQHSHPTPNGNTLTWNSANDDNNIHITYLLANAPKCVGDRAPLDKYRVKGVPFEWQADYIAASLALHVLRGEYSLATLKANMVGGATSGYSKIMYDVVDKMVRDANNFGGNNDYKKISVGGRDQFVYVGSKKLNSDQKDNKVTCQGFYISNSNDSNTISTGKDWVDTTYKGVKGKVCTLQWSPHYEVSGQDYKYYIAQLSFDKSKLPAGSKIIRPAGSVEAAEIDNNANIQVFIPDSEFKKISKDTTYRIEVEAAVPGGLYATKFTCGEIAHDNVTYQDMAWLSLGGGYQIAKFPFYVTVPQQVQPGDIKLIKKSSNTDLTNGNNNYSLEGAEYGVYEKKDCSGKASYTMTIKKGTDGTYTATQKEIPAGTWYVKETKAPKGYTLNSKVYEVEVPQNDTIEVTVEDNPITLTINLEKVSALPDCSNNNENYSLKGAVYTVYTDEKCKTPATKDGKNVTLTTDKNGKASVSDLPKDTYYVKETTASKGFSLDTTVHPVDGTSDKEASAGVISKTVNSSEIPLMDPITAIINKTDSKGNAPQSLADAQFTIKYYSKIMDTDPGKAGEVPVRTWVFKTIKYGNYYAVRYRPEHKVSGPDLYTDVNGSYKLPFGTITVQETQAPDGYKIDNTIHVIKLDGKSVDGSVVTENGMEIPNNSVDFNIVKKQYGTESVISGAVFKHTDPKGRVETVTTDKNGKASFRGLIDGKHIIEETYVDPAYFVNDHKIEFTVTGGQISKEGLDKLQFEASGTNGSIKVTANKEDGYDAVIEDKPAYYKLQMHKVNDVDTKLAGAEFTLYSDAACTKVLKKGTTDSNGILTMEQLAIGETYYLAETKAPNGYRLPLNSNGKPVVYTIKGDSSSKDNFAIVVNKKSYSGSSGEWYVSGSGSDRYAHFMVVNQRQAKLPNTGSHAMLIIVIAGLALVVGALVFERKNKKKK